MILSALQRQKNFDIWLVVETLSKNFTNRPSKIPVSERAERVSLEFLDLE